MSTFEELRSEYDSVKFGEHWLETLRAVCRQVVRGYDPSRFDAGSGWTSDAIDELCHDVVTERLLGEGQLLYVMDLATTIGSIERLLQFQVRRVLSHRRAKAF